MSNKGEGRRLSGNLPLAYDRQLPGLYPEHPLPTPPVPPAAYPPYYDRFAPEEPVAPPYHEGYTDEYNPKYWRTDREYFPHTPSPERFRPAQTEGWPHPPAWQEPEPVAWPDRREPAREPYNAQWERPARETGSTRIFEPSATWKQTHVGPSPYPESIPPSRERPTERFPDPPLREYRERPVERSRPPDVYSPSQPAAERFRPYSSPVASSSVPRNRIPLAKGRADSYRPPQPEPEWAPEDDDLYADHGEGRSKELSIASSVRPGSQGRGDRRFRSRDSVERSVSPASSRPAQHSSPGYMAAAASMPKRESPDLPHLEALPPKPAVSYSVRNPPGPGVVASPLPKSVSRSPSHSSTASSSQYASKFVLPKASQPRAAQLPAPSGLSSSVNHHPSSRWQTRSPVLQMSPMAQVSPGTDSLASTPRDELPPPRPIPDLSHSHSQQLAPVPITNAASQLLRPTPNAAPNNGRRSYLHRAPSFVPSTLAIDAKLKFPERDVAVNSLSQNAQASSSTSSMERNIPQAVHDSEENDAESDMDMSLPASPVRQCSPATLPALDVVSKVKGLRETEDAPPLNDSEEGRAASDDAEDMEDSSDMDMSPPASPAMKPVAGPASTMSLKALPTQMENEEKVEATRPALSIDTSMASPQIVRPASRRRAPPSSTASTPEPGGDESDMEMSSPTSSAAPSPRSRSPLLGAQPASKPSISQELLSASTPKVDSAAVPATTTTDPPLPTPPVRRDAAVSPILRRASLTTSRPTSGPLREDTSSSRAFANYGHAAIQQPPRSVPSTERYHTEAAELSPPVSEETLREETEGAEKDPDNAMHTPREHPPPTQKPPVVTPDQVMTVAEKMITELPLSDALRLVVSLRMRRNTPLTLLEDHVEPIIQSNLLIAEPEQPERQQPDAVIEAVTERGQTKATQGVYDGTKHSLRKRFANHKALLAEKVERLRKDYLALHEKWMVHCAKLDEIARANALEEAAATAGRTTRRSAAMGDAVRTDLEMEQILASLGNEELTDANHLSAKNAAVIPDMLSVTKGRLDPMFDDTNNLVEDPHSFYALETGIDDWSDEEKAIFLEKYVLHPKQFGIIASFLPNKTPAQCVTFYYLHKNTTIDFRKLIALHNTVGKRTRRGRGGKQKGNALLADILKHDDEVSRDSTPNASSSRRRRGPAPTSLSVAPPMSETAPEAGPSTLPAVEQLKRPTASRRSTTQNTPVGTPTPDPEPTLKRPRRRANLTAKAVAALGQEEGDDVPDEDVRPAKRTRKSRKSKAAEAEAAPFPAPADAPAAVSTPSETKFIDQTEATVRKKSASGSTNWSEADKGLFLKLLRQYGDDFKRIAASMPNKTTIQVTSFYNANLSDMELAKVAALAPKRSPTPSGSGSSIQSSTNPSTPALDNHFAAGADVHSRGNRGASPNSRSSGKLGSLAPADATISVHPAVSRRPGTAETVRLHSPATISSPSVPVSPPGLTRSPMGTGAPSRSKQSGQSPLPESMTSTFPSFPYTNLGPSHFGHPPLEPSAFVRLTAPQPNGAGVPHPVMEFSNFAPQPWMSGAHSLVGQGPIVHGGQVPGLPATLETTEDLVRYLEHRTRLTAGQSNDNDFM